MKSWLYALTHAALALATARTTPPSGALTVGTDGTYSTIQAAVDALSTTSTTAQSIFIYAGTYSEQVVIPSLASMLTVYGYTEDTSTYADNTVTITYDATLASAGTDEASGTVQADSTDFAMYNINLVNSYGDGDQALALSGDAGNQGYYACQFKGYQDTVLSETGAQLYAGCLIEGATDFIFGQSATAWFGNCDLYVLEATLGYVTASGRNSSSSDSWYVIDSSTIAAAPGETVATGAYYLGRPWGLYARVTIQNTDLSDVINSAGWAEWSSSDSTANVEFYEYENTGAGAEGTRAIGTTATAALTLADILGSDYASAAWVDTDYL